MKTKNLLLLVISAFLVTSLFIWFNIKKKDSKVETQTKIIIGTNAEYPPFAFIKDDKIDGFDIDIIKEVFRRLNKTFEIQDMSWSSLIPAIQLDKIQVIAAGITATPERANHVLFTKPYFKGDPLLIVNLSKNPPIQDITELDGKKVIVNEGYTADFYMSKIKGPILQKLPSPAQGFLALKSGRADAYVIARSTTMKFFEKYGQKEFNFIEIPTTEETYSIAVSKKHPALLDKIQQVLTEMEQDDTIQKLTIKWKLK